MSGVRTGNPKSDLDVRIGNVRAAFDAFARECILFDAVVSVGGRDAPAYASVARVLERFASWMRTTRSTTPDRIDLAFAETRLLGLVSKSRYLRERCDDGVMRYVQWVPVMLRSDEVDDGAIAAPVTIDPDGGVPGYELVMDGARDDARIDGVARSKAHGLGSVGLGDAGLGETA